MRVGFFTGTYFPRKDGVCYTVKTWKRELEKRGHEVYVIYPGVEGYDPDENEIPVASIPDPWYYGHRMPTPIGTRKFPELDIVHCHSPGSLGLLGRYYAWRKGIPSVFSFHTPLEEYIEGFVGDNVFSRLLKRLFVAADEKYLETFDVVTANTEIIRNRNIDPEPLPVGIDEGFFRPRDSDLLGDMDLERPVAGYSGRLSDEKNIGRTLEMAEEFPGTVMIVGNGHSESKLKEKAGENVVFMDYLPREDLPKFYSEIDVFVHSSTGDTFSITSVEANACGTPVVAPEVHPFDRIIEEENGRLYRLDDTREMLEKTLEAVDSDLNPREVAKKYSVEETIERLERIYGGLSDGN
ncbi:MAG: glycosyltransferase [Candidatus Nanohaloarchaea archaeon]